REILLHVSYLNLREASSYLRADSKKEQVNRRRRSAQQEEPGSHGRVKFGGSPIAFALLRRHSPSGKALAAVRSLAFAPFSTSRQLRAPFFDRESPQPRA